MSTRKPAAQKRLEGNPGHRAIPDDFVEPAGDLERPDYLDGYAVDVWERVVAAMPPGVYTPTDVGLLAAYCEACATHRTATLHIMVEGHVIRNAHGYKRSPWTIVIQQARQQIATLGTRLGLDPLARENIKAPDKRPAGKFDGLVAIDGGKRSA